MAKKLTTGAIKAARKAENKKSEKAVGKGEVALDTASSRPVVFASIDRGKGTEQKMIPVKGKLSKFNQSVGRAESRAQSFIEGKGM